MAMIAEAAEEKLRFAVVGYGKMGHLVKKVLDERGERIINVIDPNVRERGVIDEIVDWGGYSSPDVAICFTSPEAGYDVTKRALSLGVDAVVGTTKWYEKKDGTRNKEMLVGLEQLALNKDCRLLIAPNFDLTMIRMSEGLKRDSPFFAQLGYKPVILEAHHERKIADVSGTAKNLLGAPLLEAYPDKNGLWFDIERAIWPTKLGDTYTGRLFYAPVDMDVRGPSADMMRDQIQEAESLNRIPLIAIRHGDIPGIHRVYFIGESGYIFRHHVVKDRKVFAEGAVNAARMLQSKDPGLYWINELMGDEDAENK
jgi:4-hydroxy-tetrahydrodipicolinate reductase